jgi:AcrR family transcriptional regulator
MADQPLDARTQILHATWQCLAEKGSAALALRDVARAAGVALSQIHYYFGSKEGLLIEATSYIIQRKVELLQQQMAEVKTAKERLRRAIEYVRTQCLRGEVHKVYLDLLSMAAWSPRLKEETRRLQEKLVDVIHAEALRIGRRDFQTRAVARAVLGALDGIALQALQGAPAEEIDAAYAALEQILSRLLPDQEGVNDIA